MVETTNQLLGEFNGARVMITGDTGFKGAWLSAWLLELGAEVSGFALPPEGDDPLFDRLNLAARINHIDGNLRDENAVRDAIATARPDAVIHMAAQSLVLRGYREPKATFDTNVAGSVNILEALRQDQNVRALVYITSDKVYMEGGKEGGCVEEDRLGGKDPYSASKAAAEIVFDAYCRSYFAARTNFGAVSARAGNVIGGGDRAENRIVPDCINALRHNEAIQLRNPGAVRPWQHVLEPLSGYLHLAAMLLRDPKSADGAWNFGPAKADMRPVRDLADGIAEQWGGGRMEEAPDPDAPPEAPLLFLNSGKARERLGWVPRWDFSRMIVETVDWYKEVENGADPVNITAAQIKTYMEAGND